MNTRMNREKVYDMTVQNMNVYESIYENSTNGIQVTLSLEILLGSNGIQVGVLQSLPQENR